METTADAVSKSSRLQWQTNREHRSDAGRALYFDGTAVIFDDLFSDVESQARATLGLLGSEIGIENSV